MTPKKNRGVLSYFLVILLSIFCVYFIISKFADMGQKTEYTNVISHFDNYEVSYYELDLGTGELTYQLRGETEKQKYTVPYVSIFLDDTDNYRVEYNKKYPSEPLVQNYIRPTDNT